MFVSKKLRIMNIILICLLIIELVLSLLKYNMAEIRHPLPSWDDPIGCYISAEFSFSSVGSVIMVEVQIVLCFLKRKSLRWVQLGLGIATLMLYCGKYISLVISIIIGGPTYTILPLGYVTLATTMITILLMIVLLIQSRRETGKA